MGGVGGPQIREEAPIRVDVKTSMPWHLHSSHHLALLQSEYRVLRLTIANPGVLFACRVCQEFAKFRKPSIREKC